LAKIKIVENKQALILYLHFLLGLSFIPEDGGDVFLRNDGRSPNYTALQPRGLTTRCVPFVAVMAVILKRCME
jgi:hypothetical protein